MRYMLLEASSSGGLAEKVRSALASGWKLYGNPSVAMCSGQYTTNYSYIQAVTKDELA